MTLLVISGVSAAGKSTVARLLAGRFERGACVPGDAIRELMVSGRAGMRDGTGPALLRPVRPPGSGARRPPRRRQGMGGGSPGAGTPSTGPVVPMAPMAPVVPVVCPPARLAHHPARLAHRNVTSQWL